MRVESGLSFLSFRCFDSEFVIFSFFPSRRYRRRHVPYCLRNSFIEIKINRRRRRRSITARLLLYKKSLLTHTHTIRINTELLPATRSAARGGGAFGRSMIIIIIILSLVSLVLSVIFYFLLILRNCVDVL